MFNWEGIRAQWQDGKTYKELEEIFGAKASTIRSRRSREKWARNEGIKQPSRPPIHLQKENIDHQVEVQERENLTGTQQVVHHGEYEITEGDVNPVGLTEKQRMFCLYYMKYFNRTKAYQKAYGTGYHSSMKAGSATFNKPRVKEEINRLKGMQTHDLMVDARDILQKYIDIAFSDISDFMEFGYGPTDVHEQDGTVMIDEMTGNPVQVDRNYVRFKQDHMMDGTLINEVKQGRDGVSLKLEDKMKALDKLTEYFDLLNTDERKKLQNEKLRMETLKLQKEADQEHTGDERTFIITGEEEMRRYLDEQRSSDKG